MLNQKESAAENLPRWVLFICLARIIYRNFRMPRISRCSG